MPCHALQVKKRGAERLHWDVSYKEAKHLGRYHGEAVFKALVTATNEFGEIRIQFHVVTDGHDQMEDQIKKFLHTLQEFGQDGPKLMFTDNPKGDQPFMTQLMPSLQVQQDAFDRSVQLPPPPANPDCALDPSRYEVCTQTQVMNTKILAVRNLVGALPDGDRVVSLDCEWDVHRNERTGMVLGQGTVALIQLSYRKTVDGDVYALVLRVYGHRQLPRELCSLLTDPRITFVGRGIAGDLAKISRDFNFQHAPRHVLDLGTMARKRDVVRSANASLDLMVDLVLQQN